MTSLLRSEDSFEHEMLANWVEMSSIGLCVLDTTGTVVVLNHSACDLLIADAAAVMNRPVRVLFRNAIDPKAVESWALSADLRGEYLLEQLVDERCRSIQLKKSWVRDAKGDAYKIISLSDLTAVLATQRQLDGQTALENQRRQWQATNAGVVISDARQPDMPIVYANPAFEQMTGYALSEIVGKNCRFMQGSDIRQPAIEAIRKAIQTATSGYAVLRNYRRDGSLFINELFISPIRDESGQVIQFLGIQHLRSDGFR